MATSYLKEKSTGKILTSTSEQDPNNPAHTEVLNTFVTSRGWNLDDYEIGFADDDVVKEWLDIQDEAAKTYSDRRKEEYPSIEELVVALYDPEDKAEIDRRRAEVKSKYPKGAE
jgi:hypothetical protein